MTARVSRFWAGFGVASSLWAAAAAYLWFVMEVRPPEEEIAVAAPEPVVEPAPIVEEEEPRRRRRGRRVRTNGERTPTGNATTGDDLGEPGMRMIDGEGEGGEQQLSSAQIESAFDGGMGRIRRCLVLMAGDDPVTGRVTFGMRIAPSGEVRAVQLSGPSAATTGEAGDCLRSAARAIRFPSFDGPEMIVRYPLTLE